MRYYINVLPPSPLFEHIQSLESQWQGQSASPPHLTILSPRQLLPDKTEDELVTSLQKATQHIPVFQIRLLQIGSFNNMENIHVCAERTEELANCHTRLELATRSLLIARPEAHANMPHPHITIADHLSIERRTAAWQTISNEQFPETFTCHHIQLLRRGPREEKWVLIQSFPLRT